MARQAITEVKAASIRDARRAGLKYVVARESGITRRRAGKGFVYFQPDGKRVRDRATLERIRELVLPPAWESVWICASDAGHIQATGRDARGRTQYRYHQAYRETRDFNKFNHAIAFGAMLPKIRRTVTRDLARPGMPKQKLMALVVSLLDSTCFRVGNNEYARTNESYGLTTLQDEHVEVEGEKIRFRFTAKSGVRQDVSITNPKLASLVLESRRLRGSDLFQYRDETGKVHPVQAAEVNAYLRDACGENVTAKDFRTWHGTVEMMMQLSEAGPASTERDAKKILTTAVKATAERLGNRPSTCRGYYIHPDVIESYTNSKLFRALEQSAGRRTLHSYEAALLNLVGKVHKPSFRRAA